MADIATGRPLATLHGHTEEVDSLAFDSTGRLLASGGSDGAVILWDWRNRKIAAGPVRAGFVEPGTGVPTSVYHLGFLTGGPLIAGCGSIPGQLAWLDPLTAARRQRLTPANATGIGVLTMRSDGRAFATDGDDHTILVWDAETRQLLFAPLRGHTAPISALHFSAGGKTLISGDESGVIRWWRLPTESLEQRACRAANRELTDAERDEFLGPFEPFRCGSLGAN